MNILLYKNCYHIAAAFCHDTILLYFYDRINKLTGEKPYCYVSGSFPCCWNSGRVVQSCSDLYIAQCFEEYAKRGISLFLTFSNYKLQEKDLYDANCNKLLKQINEYHGGVIVGSDLLAQYIRCNYPQIKITASVLRSVNCEEKRSVEFYLSLEKHYNYIVLHPDDIFNNSLLQSIKNRNKYEILVNEECIYKCSNRKYHDDLICSLYAKDREVSKQDVMKFEKSFCPVNKHDFINKQRCTLNLNDLEHYFKLGYNTFKIQGRSNPPIVLLYDLCNYMIVEEYRRVFFREVACKFRFAQNHEELKLWKQIF